MKIVNIILTKVNGGAEKVFLDYCKVQKQRLNHDVYAIIHEDAPYSNDLDKIGVKYKKISNKFGYHDIFAINAIKDALIEFEADGAVSHAGKASILARKAIKKAKRKTGKQIYEICVNHSNNVKRSIGADMVICVNKNIFYKVIDSGQDPKNTAMIHNAIEIDPKQDKFDSKSINFSKKELIIGMMGRIDQYKGYSQAILALKKLNQDSSKAFKLKIAGTGDFQSNLEQQIQDLGLENHVEFKGWIDDKKKFFDEIDLFLFPSDNETFGLALVEAIANSTPVITSNTDGAKEIIRPNVDGIIVDLKPNETFSDRIADAISNLTKDEEKAKEMAKNAYERIVKRFSFDNLEMNLRDILGKTE